MSAATWTGAVDLYWRPEPTRDFVVLAEIRRIYYTMS